MNYQKYKIEELLKDKTFHNWVNKSNRTDVDFWNYYLMANPDQEGLFNEASRIIKGFPVTEKRFTLEIIENNWHDLIKRIGRKERLKIISRKNNWIRLSIAAGIFAILFVSIFFLLVNKVSSVTYTTLAGEVKKIELPGETEVTLQPNSKIIYKYSKNKVAEILLNGDAHFSISSKNNSCFNFNNSFSLLVEGEKADFKVFNNELPTKVLVGSGAIRLIYDGKSDSLLVGKGEQVVLEAAKQNFIKKNFILEINSV